MRELTKSAIPGYLMLLVSLAMVIAGIFGFTRLDPRQPSPEAIFGLLALMSVAFFMLRGLFVLNPNDACVLQLFGHYVGTVRTTGLRWTNPLYSRRKLTLRQHIFISDKLKVNDLDGNPIEIASIVVWRVKDTAEALFNVDDYARFVQIQTEAALRNLATRYPYDIHDEEKLSLRGHTGVIAEHLKKEIQDRLATAGIDVMEARFSHLAYAPEIAQAMLQRQQAGAIIAARSRIVEGAVGMVEMALTMLAKQKIVELDEERKAAMVSNLLVVLCGERGTQPIVNAGTIYQ